MTTTEPNLLDPVTVRDHVSRIDWDFADAPPEGGRHAVHGYPAKFIPPIPRELIQALTPAGGLVMDPFCGGGTTGVEALSLGRRFFGIDANAFAIELSRVKLSPMSDDSLANLEQFLVNLDGADVIGSDPNWVPRIPNIEKWYHQQTLLELGSIRGSLSGIEGPEFRLARLALASAAAKLSFQESETRYVSRPRSVKPGEALELYRKTVRRMAASIQEPIVGEASITLGDARNLEAYLSVPPDSVDAIITSPPYPNSYDYHLYHRFRLFWLGDIDGHSGPSELRRVEIGSHLTNQSKKDPIVEYTADMSAVMENGYRLLVPGGYLALVVGDGLHSGKLFPTAERLAEAAQDIGYEYVVTVNRNLPQNRRSVTSAGRRLKQEQIVILRKPGRSMVLPNVVPPRYEMFDYELGIRQMEIANLSRPDSATDDDGSELTLIDRLRRVTFARAIDLDGHSVPTFQALHEDSSDGVRPKSSTYGPHGIHRYKGKFYPQLAKSLINCSYHRDGLVIDPFGGSGTTATEAILAGRDAVTFDCNPLAIETARAKITSVTRSVGEVQEYLNRLMADVEDVRLRNLPSALARFPVEVREEVASWFAPKVIRRLAAVLELVNSEPDEELSRIGRVLISDLIREVSQQEPRDLRIRRRAVALVDAPVEDLFLERIARLQGRMGSAWAAARSVDPPPGQGLAVLGDSGRAGTFQGLNLGPVSAVVSSPPYGTALPYLDTDRLSLAAVFGYSKAARKALETQLIGTRETTRGAVVAAREDLEKGRLGLPATTESFLMQYFHDVSRDASAGFRKVQGPALLTRYFSSMRDVLANLEPLVKEGGDVWYVLGDSRTQLNGEWKKIPVVDEVRAIGENVGFTLKDQIDISVTREALMNAKNAITKNSILHFKR